MVKAQEALGAHSPHLELSLTVIVMLTGKDEIDVQMSLQRFNVDLRQQILIRLDFKISRR